MLDLGQFDVGCSWTQCKSDHGKVLVRIASRREVLKVTNCLDDFFRPVPKRIECVDRRLARGKNCHTVMG